MKLTINGLAVDPAVGSVRLEKRRCDAAATLTAVLWQAPADTYFLHLALKVGDVVRLTEGGEERFLGSVHAISRTPERVTLTAFDRGVYLARNEVFGLFAGTGGDICRQTAARLGIPVGEVDAQPGYQVVSAPAGINAFSLLRQAAGEDREITVENGALTVRRRRSVTFLLRSEHIRQVSASADLRGMVNRCVVTDRRGRTLAAAGNDGDSGSYGVFQTVLGQDGQSPAAQAQSALRGRAMAAEVTVHGNAGYVCGAFVRGQQPQWGLDGLYVITAAAHRWERADFITELTLAGAEEGDA